MLMTKEEKFYKALRDVFVGAKVEGESGYINLMRIKARYYEKGVFPKLQQNINEALKPFPTFRDELFEKLYDFFHRYFSESGSIYFRYTPLHQNVYEKVYTEDKDVMLFWKTHMLYYVKTDRLFRSMEMEVDGQKFFFDVSMLEHKKANEKRNIIYSFKEKRKNTLVFMVAYSEKGKKTKTDEITKSLRQEGDKISEDILEHAFHIFEKQSEVDYFINKDAKAFLEEQFNLWLYQYMFSGVSEWTQTRIKQLQTLKDIAFKIIAFISQFENELVKIWNKPKFVLNSNYVITLDRIADKDISLVEKLLAHKNFKSQIEEWQQLGIVDESFKKTAVLEKVDKGKQLTEPYQHLPIDTRHFKDLELDILGVFDNLDAALDGWLIKSENYQALNTILSKFTEKVQVIYIDPPFNTGDDFLYRDQFRDSTWLTLMDNRIELAKPILTRKGTLFLHLDWNANYDGRQLLNSTFSKVGFINEIVWRIGWVSGFKTQAEGFVRNHDTIFFYAKDPTSYLFKKADAVIPYKSFDRKTIETELASIVKKWKLMDKKIKNVKIAIKDDQDTVYKLGLTSQEGGYWMEDTWNCSEYEDLHSNKIKRNAKEYTPNGSEITQKPEQLLKRIVELASNERDIILDFFSGTATSLAVAQKLKRKWLGVEFASYFETDALYRMKHVLAGQTRREPVGISKSVSWTGGGFFKYYEMEQYEDTLRCAKYGEGDLFDDPNKDAYHQYIFLRDLKMLEALEVDTKGNKVKVDLSKLWEGIDIAETISNLTGKWIKRIKADSVEFEDGEVVDTKNLDWKLIKPLVWW